MQRAFVTQGTWETPKAPSHDAKAHKRATLRVSALVTAGVLASAMLPGLEMREPISAPAPQLRTAPEIVKVVLKEEERVPTFGDITASATLRRANPVSLEGLPRSRMTPVEPAQREPVREAEALEPHTIRHEGRVLRLVGIVPPRPEQMCRRLDGMQVSCIDRALSYMNLLIKGRRLSCDDAPAVKPEADAPPQASCRAGEADLAEAMVRQGWAKAGEQPEERFLLAESAARKQRLGLWQ
jgi:endonuclease YncB( thermonuclease family)